MTYSPAAYASHTAIPGFEPEPESTASPVATCPVFRQTEENPSGMTPVEVRNMIADPSGHGITNTIRAHKDGEQYIRHGARLKTPWRVLWHAETLGLTDQLKDGGRLDTRPISLERILVLINTQNAMSGQKPISASTVENALSPLARDLLNMFGIKLLIDRGRQMIRLMSEAWAQGEFSEMKRHAERVFDRYTEILEQCENAGIDASGALGTCEPAARFAAVSGRVLAGANGGAK